MTYVAKHRPARQGHMSYLGVISTQCVTFTRDTVEGRLDLLQGMLGLRRTHFDGLDITFRICLRILQFLLQILLVLLSGFEFGTTGS